MILKSNLGNQEIFENFNLVQFIIFSIFIPLLVGIIGTWVYKKIELLSKKGRGKKLKMEKDLELEAGYYRDNPQQYLISRFGSILIFLISVSTFILTAIFFMQTISYLDLKYLPEINIYKEGFIKTFQYLTNTDKILFIPGIISLIFSCYLVIKAQGLSSHYSKIWNHMIKNDYLKKDNSKKK